MNIGNSMLRGNQLIKLIGLNLTDRPTPRYMEGSFFLKKKVSRIIGEIVILKYDIFLKKRISIFIHVLMCINKLVCT